MVQSLRFSWQTEVGATTKNYKKVHKTVDIFIQFPTDYLYYFFAPRYTN
jgi:hypothetical protein